MKLTISGVIDVDCDKIDINTLSLEAFYSNSINKYLICLGWLRAFGHSFNLNRLWYRVN